MGHVDKKEVEHIASLSRIKLSQSEIAKFRDELSNILKYIDKLDELVTESVDPTSQISGLKNSSREDIADIGPGTYSDKLTNLAPNTDGGYVKVPGVLSDKSK